MVGIRWSKKALDDFYNHIMYIENQSPQNAVSVAKKVMNKIDLLEDFPQMGRVVPELNSNEIREILVYQYRIVYRLMNTETVEIISIFHSKQLIDNNSE